MIFQKIARLLKSEINGNSWHVGDLLPSEAELAVRYNVSRNTLRKALSLLEGEGIIHRKHGSGTYIQKKNFVAHIDHMNSFSEIAHKSGKEAGSQIMKFEVQDASPTIATELNLVTGEQVYYIKRLRFIEDNAAQLEETWMSVARFPDLTVSHMQKSKFSYIENECGIKIIGTFETFSPTFPTPEIASILRISPRDPILKIQTQAVDSNSIPGLFVTLQQYFRVPGKVLFPAIKADAQSAGITFCAYGLASDLYRFTPPQAKYIDIQPGHNEHRTEKLQTR